MFTLGIPGSQYRRTTHVLSHQGTNPINYDELKQEDGFYLFSFPNISEDEFKTIILLLKKNGITTIGADEQLTEKKIMKVNLLFLTMQICKVMVFICLHFQKQEMKMILEI